MANKLRIVFAGTPEFAAQHLAALLADDQFEVVAVYTQPDRPAGRGKKLHASAVKQLALDHHLPVEQPLSFKSIDAQQQLQRYTPDVMVVVAYGLLLLQDRKSTRLNSSHVRISYAVFCLKKKK